MKFGINKYPFAYGVWMPKNFAVFEDGENNKGRANGHKKISDGEEDIRDDWNKVSDVTEVSTVDDISSDRANKNRKTNTQRANLRNEKILNKNKYKKEKAQKGWSTDDSKYWRKVCESSHDESRVVYVTKVKTANASPALKSWDKKFKKCVHSDNYRWN